MILPIDGKSKDTLLEVSYGVAASDLKVKFMRDLETAFDRITEEKYDLWQKKQASYGPNNISALGLKGIFVRMWDKMQRLRTLVWLGQDNSLTDESVEDTFGDMHVYATMALMVMRGEWPEYVDLDMILEEMNK